MGKNRQILYQLGILYLPIPLVGQPSRGKFFYKLYDKQNIGGFGTYVVFL